MLGRLNLQKGNPIMFSFISTGRAASRYGQDNIKKYSSSNSLLGPLAIAAITVALVFVAGSQTRQPGLLFLLPIIFAAAYVFFRYPSLATLLVIAFIPMDTFSNFSINETSAFSFTKFVTPLALLGTFARRGEYDRQPVRGIDMLFLVYVAYVILLLPFSPFAEPAEQFVIKICSMLMLYYIVVFWGDNDKRFIHNLIWVLVISSAVSSVFGFFSIYTQGNPFTRFQDDSLVRVTGASGISPNDYAYILFLPLFLSIGLLFSRINGKCRFWALLCFLGISSSLLYTYSRSAIVSIVFACVLVFIFLLRKLDARVFLAIPLALLIGFFIIPDTVYERMATLFYGLGDSYYQEVSLSRRGNYLKVGAAILADYPLLGGGLGSFSVYHADPQYQTIPILYGLKRMPHNVYLQVAAETGLLGLFLFALPLIALFVLMKRSLDSMDSLSASLLYAAAMAGLLSSFFMGFFLHLLFNKTFWITLAFCRVIGNNHADPTRYRTLEHRW